MFESVLDHGYVRVIEWWGGGDAKDGNECGVIEAARQSTQGSFRGWEQDQRLLTFLYEHKHMTPFEFAGMTLEIKAPIMVFREWHRHRTQSYNEASARYAPLPDENYVPSLSRVMRSDNYKRTEEIVLTEERAESWREAVKLIYSICEQQYQNGLQAGIPRELARLILPVGRYSKMRATANLRNWLQFLTLRCDPAAQEEIRLYANVVADMVEKLFPKTHELWLQNR